MRTAAKVLCALLCAALVSAAAFAEAASPERGKEQAGEVEAGPAEGAEAAKTPQTPRKCSACGKECPEGTKRCPECRAEVEGPEPPPVAKPVITKPVIAKPAPAKPVIVRLVKDADFAAKVERALYSLDLAELEKIEKSLKKPGSDADLARQALVWYTLAKYHEVKENKKKKKVRYAKRALKALAALIKKRPKDPYPCIYASKAAQILAYSGGMMAGMRYGPKIGKYALKAIEIDPDSFDAKLLQLDRYGRAPKFEGGDLDKALKETEKAFAETSKDDERGREVEYRLFYVYLKRGMKGKADATEKSLREKHPENKYLHGLIDLDRRKMR